MNTFQILMSASVWLDALERFYRAWQMAYFRPFSNVISIKGYTQVIDSNAFFH
jgi:hypothetical protein